MPFVPKTQPGMGKINTVVLGTGSGAIALGGQRALPFYHFDAPMENRPKIGVEISDDLSGWDVPGLRAFYAGCHTMAERARRAQTIEEAAFLCLRFAGADPAGANRTVAECAADAEAVAEGCDMPIAVMGCGNMEKDEALFSGIARALAGRNVLFLSARSENYQTLGETVVLSRGQKLAAETADDVNLAKQLNIMLKGMAVPAESLVMNLGTAAVGYGYEYLASTLDRVRHAALFLDDEDLQMPIVLPVSPETWSVKESTASEEDEPAWGSREERGIQMEIVTAAAGLAGGADGVILRHPAAIATVGRLIAELA